MKEKDCGYYFLSSTALRIWKDGDEEGVKRMLACLSDVHKEPWFRRVMYKNKAIDGIILREMAETVFFSTWEAFTDHGKLGRLQLDKQEYTGYFFTAFKGNYLKSLARELKRVEAEKEFERRQPAGGEGDAVVNDAEKTLHGEELLSIRAQRVLGKISPDCRQLLIWKHIEGLSHDEIAEKKSINRNSSIKMVSRCGRRFSEVWREINQKAE